MIENKDVKVSVELTEGNRLYAECHNIDSSRTYAFDLYKNGKKKESFTFGTKANAVFWLTEPGEYTVTAFVKEQETVAEGSSAAVNFEGVSIVVGSGKKKRFNPFGWVFNIVDIAKEIWVNRSRMYRIAKYDYKMLSKDSYLGRAWNILSPLIQIGAFWFVFGIGIRGGNPVTYEGVEYPFLAWMLCGLIPWFFINNSIIRGAGSVYAKAQTAMRLRYPMSTIPAGSTLVEIFDLAVLMCILIATLFAYRIWPDLHWLNLVYYVAASYILLTSLAMLTSTLTMIARDFQLLINALMRLLFYITPILWTVDKLPEKFQFVLKLNPFLYVISGFRDSLLYGKNFWEHPLWLAYFWVFTIFLLGWGCSTQKRYKDRFLDLL